MKRYEWAGCIVEGPLLGEENLFGMVKYKDGKRTFGHSGKSDALVGTKWEGRGWYIRHRYLKEINLNLENV